MQLIGITGKAGAGKDEVAKVLKSHGYATYAAAWPIKEMLRVLGLDPEKYADRAKKEEIIPWLGVSYRHLAQTLGTEWGRDCVHPDLWVKLAAQRFSHLCETYGTDGTSAVRGMVLTDVRFQNEADMVHFHGGVVIHVTRNPLLCTQLKGQTAIHSSEGGVLFAPQRDMLVKNNGTLEDLEREVTEQLTAWFLI